MDYITRRRQELDRLYNQLPELSEDQKSVSQQICAGNNVFLTGSPGCGKSVSLLSVVRDLLKRGYKKERDFYLAAPTGVAAYLIGGLTLHRAFSLPVTTPSDFEEAYEAVFSMKRRSWFRLKYLIIDEISMVSGRNFSMVDYFLKRAKKNTRPFGGVTVLCVGDFCQLPPVPNTGETEDTVQFAFETQAWKDAQFRTVNLTIPFRQLGDTLFIDLITRMRYGQTTKEDVGLLLERCNIELEKDQYGVEPTYLFTHRYMVDEMNQQKLDELPTPLIKLKSKDFYQNDYWKKELEKICPSPPILKLKAGAQIMVTRNIYHDGTDILILTNGTRGVVQEIGVEELEVEDGTLDCTIAVKCIFETGVTYKFYPQMTEWAIDGKKERFASRLQIPLMLCWALTVHKSQGQTIPRGYICIDEAFASGQVMVAVSRFRALKTLGIIGTVDPRKITVNQRVIDFYNQL